MTFHLIPVFSYLNTINSDGLQVCVRRSEERSNGVSNVIRVSEAASLALHAAALVAAGDGEPLTSSVISSRLEASVAHMAKVLQRLVRAGLMTSARGPRGGYRLTRPPAEITLLNVYEAVEGPFQIEHCLFGEPVCRRKRCPLGDMMSSVSEEIRSGLASTSVEDFAANM